VSKEQKNEGLNKSAIIFVSKLVDLLQEMLPEITREELAIVTHAVHFAHFSSKKVNPYRGSCLKICGPTLGSKLLSRDGVGWDIPFAPPKNPKFTFVDLFAGIGGMRSAFQNLGGLCVFSSEWDKFSQKTYFANYGEIPFGDITAIELEDVPKHDILTAGFPCQAFSIAGNRGGFTDIRGTLFFDVARLIAGRSPDAFLLENVKGLTNHDRGNTLKTILGTLRDDLGYFVPDPQVINAKDFGLPQSRERIFIVGFKSQAAAESFRYPKSSRQKKMTIGDIREKNRVDARYYLSDRYLNTLVEHRKRHEGKGNGFGYQILSDKDIANAIVVGGMGRERNLIVDKSLKDFTPTTKIIGEINRDGIRRMTPREWARLQGFKDHFLIPVSDAQAYKQFGNSVAIPAIQSTGNQILKALGIS
jgi:DNA (cytosine-5)-methyltransferase 1